MNKKTAILVILEVLTFAFFEKIPQLKVLKIQKYSLYNTQISHEIEFGNFRMQKTAILVIL